MSREQRALAVDAEAIELVDRRITSRLTLLAAFGGFALGRYLFRGAEPPTLRLTSVVPHPHPAASPRVLPPRLSCVILKDSARPDKQNPSSSCARTPTRRLAVRGYGHGYLVVVVAAEDGQVQVAAGARLVYGLGEDVFAAGFGAVHGDDEVAAG